MIIIIDKPVWVTSFDIVRKVKRLFFWEKVWHGGTLDPNASGLLVVAIGKDTKKLHDMLHWDKEYITTIDFSIKSDTWDIDSENIESIKLKNSIKISQIKDILDSFVWDVQMQVPYYSAKKINWKKMYESARKWEYIEKYEIMKIYSYNILDYSFPKIKIQIKVGWGTYIRSIAYELGKKLWVGWVLSDLRRTKVWKFSLWK